MLELRCPNCSGPVQVDEQKEFGTCPFCGVSFQVFGRQKILIEHTDPSFDQHWENLKTMADQFFEAKNYVQAESCYQQAMEMKTQNLLAYRLALCQLHLNLQSESALISLLSWLEKFDPGDLVLQQQVSRDLCDLAISVQAFKKPDSPGFASAVLWKQEIMAKARVLGEILPWISGDLCDPPAYCLYLERSRRYALAASKAFVRYRDWDRSVHFLSIPFLERQKACIWLRACQNASLTYRFILTAHKKECLFKKLAEIQSQPAFRWIIGWITLPVSPWITIFLGIRFASLFWIAAGIAQVFVSRFLRNSAQNWTIPFLFWQAGTFGWQLLRLHLHLAL